MVFNATFDNISVIAWQSFYWMRKPEYPAKTTNHLSFFFWPLYYLSFDLQLRCTPLVTSMIKFVSDLRQVDGFLWVLRFPPSIKLTARYN